MQKTAGVRSTDLGRFLQNRRSGLRPEDLGIDDDGKRRRVAGLRREEVAHLARVSVNYYTRLEQGQNRSASPEVLDALATALCLNQGERAHLHDLARVGGSSKAVTPAEPVRPAVARMVAAYEQGPAVVLGRQVDILAWNRLAHLLFSGHLDVPETACDAQLNLAELVFLEPGARQLYPSWAHEAREMAGYLRMVDGRYPGDEGLAALIRRLRQQSPEFAELWSGHVVWDKTYGTRCLHHPAVGAMTLTFETFRMPDTPDQCVILYQAEEGSPSARALRSLLTADRDATDIRTTDRGKPDIRRAL
ncbi:helix-turn-helix transcriptional regulator [Streptomyces sp. NPDC059009]|uniref:helix-turn-helix transcriptional regulator n=1 Tax=Streptomyces sp. NPDC059009 TaxID=3346694 RepID=UPI0036A8DE46